MSNDKTKTKHYQKSFPPEVKLGEVTLHYIEDTDGTIWFYTPTSDKKWSDAVFDFMSRLGVHKNLTLAEEALDRMAEENRLVREDLAALRSRLLPLDEDEEVDDEQKDAIATLHRLRDLVRMIRKDPDSPAIQEEARLLASYLDLEEE